MRALAARSGRSGLRIGLAAHLLSYPRASQSGVGSYIRLLLQSVPAALGQHELEVFWAQPSPVSLGGAHHRSTRLPLSSRLVRLPYEQVWLPLLSRRAGIDVFHQPDPSYSRLRPAPRVVVTVHDLAAFRYAETFGTYRARYKQAVLRRAVHAADHVVADSASTRADVLEHCDVDPDRVTVVHLGLDPRWQPVTSPDDLADTRRRLGIPERFVLHVGAMEPRKNLPRLIEAYGRARHRGMDAGLVLAGPSGWLSEETQRAPARWGVENDVTFVGHVSFDDLRALYSQARALAYPALYEGFGLPVLEAMACGAPVVTSNVSSLPEVAGDAAVLVDPTDVDAIATGLERVTGDPTLRDELIEAGRRRIERFSLARMAAATVAAYEAAAAR